MIIKKDIFNSVDIFDTALEITFDVFLYFYLVYPKNNSATLEMIQRYFLKIHSNQKVEETHCNKEKGHQFNDKTFLKQYIISKFIFTNIFNFFAFSLQYYTIVYNSIQD